MSCYPCFPTEEMQKRYMDEFKKPSIQTTEFNPFKIIKCKQCDQIVVMRLIYDSSSNSSCWIYAGMCVNGHWNQQIPCIPYDLNEPPRCNICLSTMQWKMSIDYTGWICIQKHESLER